jgi:hypothetical protein
MQNVVVLEAVEIVLWLAELLTVHHLLIKARPFFISLVDYQQQVSQNLQSLNVEWCGDLETMKKCFILGCIVGCWKIHLQNIFEIFSLRRGYKYACTYTLKLQGYIKIDGLVLQLSLQWWWQSLDLLSDEVA